MKLRKLFFECWTFNWYLYAVSRSSDPLSNPSRRDATGWVRSLKGFVIDYQRSCYSSSRPIGLSLILRGCLAAYPPSPRSPLSKPPLQSRVGEIRAKKEVFKQRQPRSDIVGSSAGLGSALLFFSANVHEQVQGLIRPYQQPINFIFSETTAYFHKLY